MITRRKLLIAGIAAPFAADVAAQPLTCGTMTERQTAGPYFKPNSPQRASFLEKNANAATLVVSGMVLSAQCKPVARALLDFWHCDEQGEYDNSGFRYRGHLFTDGEGRWKLETIFPAEYPGRARHIHVNIQAPGRRILTTQLYFPGDKRDGLYRDALVIRVATKEPKRIEGSFDFVVQA